jgi:hypothetical protein
MEPSNKNHDMANMNARKNTNPATCGLVEGQRNM